LPPELLSGPFHMRRATELGVTRRVLERRFVRVHPRVWCHPDHVMTHADRVNAAALAMPEQARLTGISRIQALGVDFGPRDPIRFIVQGDLHLAMTGVFLHRTKRLPPTDGVGVIPAAAFMAYCARARVIDAVKIGDWLLNRRHMTIDELRALALLELWRPGAHEAIWILEHLDGRARSLPESEVRALLVSTGLPAPELNVAVDDEGRVICDLVYRRWRTVVEHEGSHHQEDRQQYNLDIGRYAWMRRQDVEYVQSTHEKLGNPRSLVGEVYVTLRRRGYDGPPPVFGERWHRLFMRVSEVIGREYPPRR
jgi:hypothetical protein